MEKPKYKTALIVGAGEGLSASLARLFAREGLRVALAARRIEKLGALCTETGARRLAGGVFRRQSPSGRGGGQPDRKAGRALQRDRRARLCLRCHRRGRG